MSAKTYTGEPMAPDHPLGSIYTIMDRHGMLPDDIFCVRCAKPLNMDGGHPAELYAGTYNGLCYGCTGTPAYIKAVSPLDGCRKVSWPPSSPSWRRDRVTHYGYEDCETCGGMGIELPAYRGWTNGGQYCRLCSARYDAHPVRRAASHWSELAWKSLEATFSRAVDHAAGVPARCTKKRRTELREAFIGPAEEKDRRFTGPRTRASTEFLELRATYRPGAERVRALIRDHFAALGAYAWAPPEPEDPEEFYRAYCKWRKIDPDTELTYGYPQGFRYAHQPKPLCRQHRPWDGCKECHARYLDTLTLGQVEDGYHLGNVGQVALDAYRHLWATSAHRYSSIPWGWEDEPTDPKVIEMVALIRRAAEERKAAS